MVYNKKIFSYFPYISLCKKCAPPPFDLLNPYRGQGYVKGQNNCLNSVLCFIPFNLICNMTTFRKENKITFDPTPGVKGKCVPYISLCKTCVSQAGAFFSSRHDLNNLGRCYIPNIQALCLVFSDKKNFSHVAYISLYKTCGGAMFGPRDII